MAPDNKSSFGTYAPRPIFRFLIALAQNAPHNGFGRALAKAARSWVCGAGKAPLDVVVGEIKLRCYLWNNHTERKFVFMPWYFDHLERKFIFSLLPKNGVFLDLGANVGVYTLEAATHLNSSGRILAFEPYPPIHDRLQFNIAATRAGRSEWPQLQVLRIGVADESKTFDLHLNPDNLGQNSIVRSSDNTEEVVSVSCEPLLQILERESVQRVDVLKIDIEGAEDMALCPFLETAPDALLPKAILMENSEAQWQRDLPGMLTSRGYRIGFRGRMNTVYQRS